MASRHCALPFRGRAIRPSCRRSSDFRVKPASQPCIRSIATEVPSTASSSLPPTPKPTAHIKKGLIVPSKVPAHILPEQNVLTTVYSWPELKPLKFSHYPSTHLAVPLRRDILHKAVIFEGDKSRQGTASTKHRGEVHGSGRKIRPQKGTGHARLGDKKSPMLRGGGVAHGPKPRSFATELPKKMYHKAWRMALSYRYRRGQLVVVDNLQIPENIKPDDRPYWLRWALDGIGWSKGKEGHSFFITMDETPNRKFLRAIKKCDNWGRARTYKAVDVKNLLEMKRIVIEEKALQVLLRTHQHDLKMPVVGKATRITTSASGAIIPPAVERLSEEEMAKAVAEAQAIGQVRGGAAGDFATNAAAAATVTSLSGLGANALSMDEVDGAAAEAELRALEGEDDEFEEDEFDEEEEEEDDEEFEDDVEEDFEDEDSGDRERQR